MHNIKQTDLFCDMFHPQSISFEVEVAFTHTRYYKHARV